MRIDKIGIEVELTVMRLRRPIVCDFLPYTKEDPLDLDGTLYHKDASMFELALSPASSGKELDSIYERAFDEASNLIPSDAGLACLPAATYSDAELAKDSYASVLGCGASHNLYGKSKMPAQYEDNTRYAGMHINISMEDGYSLSPGDVLKLDTGIGLYSVINFEQDYREEAIKRRSVYGKAGEHRVKDFGIEYRTPLASTWPQMGGQLLFELVDGALNGPSFDDLRSLGGRVQQAIDNCDADAANSVLTDIYGARGVAA